MLVDHPVGGSENASKTVEPAKFLIIDDHPLFRDALQSTILLTYPRAQFTEASSVEEAKAIAAYDRFDLILLDLGLPQTPGFAGFLALQSLHPRMPIVVVSPLEEASLIEEAKAYGAMGFIAKAAFKAEVMRIIQLAMTGEVAFPPQPAPSTTGGAARHHRGDMAQRFKLLTPMQRRVLDLLRQGKFNKQIAYELGAAEIDGEGARHRNPAQTQPQLAPASRHRGYPVGVRPSAAGFGSSSEFHDFRPPTFALSERDLTTSGGNQRDAITSYRFDKRASPPIRQRCRDLSSAPHEGLRWPRLANRTPHCGCVAPNRQAIRRLRHLQSSGLVDRGIPARRDGEQHRHHAANEHAPRWYH